MEKFFAAVRNMFNVPDLRRRIFFTLGLLAVYRFGAHVSAPGINGRASKKSGAMLRERFSAFWIFSQAATFVRSPSSLSVSLLTLLRRSSFSS